MLLEFFFVLGLSLVDAGFDWFDPLHAEGEREKGLPLRSSRGRFIIPEHCRELLRASSFSYAKIIPKRRN